MKKSACRAVVWWAAIALAACAAPPGKESSAPAVDSPTASPGNVLAIASAAATSAPPPTVPAVQAPPLQAVEFASAVARAGHALFDSGAKALGDEVRDIVVDPLIDANTGAQTVDSVRMGDLLAAIVAKEHPNWKLVGLSRRTLSNQPLLLIGTLTPINSSAAAGAVPDAFRIWLTLVDLRSGRIVAKNLDRATGSSVNAQPTRYFADSPTWHKDKTTNAYINSCQVNSKVGDPIDPLYLMRLPAAALINEAIAAYAEGRLKDAYRLFGQAREIADPFDLRVLNGLYLTGWRLGKRQEAASTFAEIVTAEIAAKRLMFKLLFAPGTTAFLPDLDLQSQYKMWLPQIATQLVSSDACIGVVGHTSRSGNPETNDALSRRRAEVVGQLLVKQSKKLEKRVSATGVGWRENLIGIGTDDARDALDRRVEFQLSPCGA